MLLLTTLSFIFTVNEILGAAAKERSAESPSSTEESKSSKGIYTLMLNAVNRSKLDTQIKGMRNKQFPLLDTLYSMFLTVCTKFEVFKILHF